MATNVEIKARVDDLDALCMRAAALADDGPHELLQDDTFFRVPDGRLKLRVFSDGQGELIYYQRADTRGPRASFYLISRTPDPDPLRASLAAAWGEAGRVRKHRTLFLAGRTRIHLDRVEGLGNFLELEVVLSDHESVAHGQAEARRLMTALGVSDAQLLDVAYVDLLDAVPTATLPRAQGPTAPQAAGPTDPQTASPTDPQHGTAAAGPRAENVVLRPFQRDDTEGVIDLWQRCGLTRPWNDPLRDIDRKLTVQPDLFVVARSAGRVIGTVMAGYDGHRGWVNYLAVCPTLQGRGLGKRLMRHVEQALTTLGCPKLNLQIRTSNAAVRAFYESIGYSLDDAFSMGRRLIPDTPPPAA